MPLARGLMIVGCLGAALAASARADDVLLKNKILYRGTVDRDNTLRQISDGVKRIVIRDSRIEKITPSDPYRGLERFAIDQPIKVHAGAMPEYAIGIQSTPWDDKGRRRFSYLGPRAKTPITMIQAINDLGPHVVRFRGVDGFWVGQVATSEIPKEVILGLLARVDRTILNERQRIARFLLQAEWYAEAKTEVESIAKDFPDEKEQCQRIVQTIQDLDARQKLQEIMIVRQSRRPRDLLARLRAFPTENVAPEVLAEARDMLRKEEALAASDRALGESLRELQKMLSTSVEKAWTRQIAEILKDLEAAPDAVRGRLEPFQKADPGVGPEAKLALAMSGWIVGADAATSDLNDASALWKSREHVLKYLKMDDEPIRQEALSGLRTLEFIKDSAHPDGRLEPDGLTRIVQFMPPPRAPEVAVVGKPVTHRVANDLNPEPTEYMVMLPPEYHPLRSYPTVVALHDGRGPQWAIDAWSKEAARRGYIVVAPEYLIPNQTPDYRYTEREHASVELSIRDARKRYAIDSDRIYLGGQLMGGHMALDFGLAHPDLFAGVATISGVPAKFAYAYRKHVEMVPLYLVIGDIAMASRSVIFDGYAKPMITDVLDVTYVEYYRRGLEDLPEEIPPIFDWFDKHRRDPVPKSFEAFTARPNDARFFGVVVQEHAAGRIIAPEAADILGKNINPAKLSFRSSTLSNLLNITTNGVTRLDVWVSPKLVDFKRRLEIRINGRAAFKNFAKPDIAAMLTDLRFRGDRQQLYWFKFSTRL
jgi:pimeloyl-ACP methyl ester carboxylesterase